MVKPLSRIVGFGPLILGIPILVGEIKPHLHDCGSKQNTFVGLQSSSIPSFWPNKKIIFLWFLVNEVKSTCFQTWVKTLSGWNKNGSEKKRIAKAPLSRPALPSVPPALPSAQSHRPPLRGDQRGYRGGSSDDGRFTKNHQESGVHWVHLFIAILSSKDTWLLRKNENLSNTNGQNGRSKRRDFQDLINKRAGISNKINKDEDLFHQQPCVFHLHQWSIEFEPPARMKIWPSQSWEICAPRKLHFKQQERGCDLVTTWLEKQPREEARRASALCLFNDLQGV